VSNDPALERAEVKQVVYCIPTLAEVLSSMKAVALSGRSTGICVVSMLMNLSARSLA
jgi:hypothetical protein